MTGSDAELAHYVAQTRGIEVLARDACCSTCDGCGTCPSENISICRDVGGDYSGVLYLCNDCIAESWARAPSQRDSRSAEEMEKEAEERQRETMSRVTAELIRTNPNVQEVLREIAREVFGTKSPGAIVVETEAPVEAD